MGRSLISLAQLLETDLEAVCRDLREELGAAGRPPAADHRRRRLPRLLPGAGGAALEPARAAAPPIDVTVYDNYVRGVPAWLEALRARPAPRRSSRHDMTAAAARRTWADFDYIIHAAGIASPIYYRAAPARDDGRQHQRACATCSTTRVAERDAGRPARGLPVLLVERDLRRPGAASAIPTPETYRGNVSCTGPRACYDESKRFGETLCVTFAQQYGRAGQDRAAVQQLRPGPEDHRPAA